MRYHHDMETRSQLQQDLFVIETLKGKRNGTYVEIGANHPENISNTFILERDFGWSGVSVDINDDYWEQWKATRKNPLVIADGTKVHRAAFGGLADEIDYLSVDCEPAEQTFRALKHILSLGFQPTIITFEHERYSEGDKIRDEARAFLESLGYDLVREDVGNFEDWFVLISRL